MKVKRTILIIGMIILLLIPASFAFSEYDPTTAEQDMKSLVNGMSDLFAKSLGGMSYVGDPVGYAFIKHFSIGIGGGAVLIPIDNLSFDSSGLDIDFGDLEYIPIPTASAFAKLSIRRLEIGFKLGGIPQYDVDNFSIHNMILGGKLRYNIKSFNLVFIKGGVSAGALFEYMSGGLDYSTSKGYPVYLDVDGTSTHVADVTTTASLQNSWKAATVGGEAQAYFQVLFLNFFVGSRLSKTFGTADSSITGTAKLTPVDQEYVVNGLIKEGELNEGNTVSVTASNKAPGIEVYGFGGAEFKLFIFTITARGSYNFIGKTLSADVGARLQF